MIFNINVKVVRRRTPFFSIELYDTQIRIIICKLITNLVSKYLPGHRVMIMIRASETSYDTP